MKLTVSYCVLLLLLWTELELYLLLGKTAVMILFRFIFYSNCMNSLHICTFTIISFTLVFFFFCYYSLLLSYFQRSSLLFYVIFSTDFFFVFFVVNQKTLNNLQCIFIHCYYTSLLFQMIITIIYLQTQRAKRESLSVKNI